MKPDAKLLVLFKQLLRDLRPKIGSRVQLQSPVAGFADAEQVDLAIAQAEQKLFVEKVVRSESKDGPKWAFDLTTRGAEACNLD